MLAYLLRCILLVLLLGLGLGLMPARANHVMGGELTYRWLQASVGSSTYQLSARIYFSRATSYDGDLDVVITVLSKAPGNALLFRRTVTRSSSGWLTTPGYYCIAGLSNSLLATYNTTVTLPMVAEGYTASFNLRARNGEVVNLVSPLSTDVFIATEIPPADVVNSSPTFAAHAVAQACLGETSVMTNTAYDADGDRLSYALAAPLNNAQTTAYVPGYSQTQPFGTDGTAALDEQTGVLTYLCRRQGAFELALDVKEYRTINGREVLLGTMRRDIQITVRVCQNNVATNQAPVFTAASLATHDFQIQEGQSLDFTFTANDPEGQVEVMTVRSTLLDGPGGIAASVNGDPGNGSSTVPLGSVVANATATVTGAFHLLTTCGMARATPYEVLVTVEDADACNKKATTVLFRITVVGPPGPGGISGDANVCAGTLATYTATGSAYSSYQWTVQGGQLVGAATGPTVQVRWDGSGPGQLAVTGALQGSCRTAATSKAVAVAASLVVSGPTAYCRTASTGLQYTVAGPPAAYTWSLTGGTIVSGQGTNALVVDIATGSPALLHVAPAANASCVTTVPITLDDSCLYFYNVVTPNADGRNDVFEIENVARHPGTGLTVFNRWGRKVYESADYHNDFGDAAAVGVYYYHCQLTDGTTYKGWVEIVR